MDKTRLNRFVVLSWLVPAALLLGVCTLPAQEAAEQTSAEPQTTVSVDLQEVELSEALAEICEQTGWAVCQSEALTGKVTLKANDADPETVLGQLVDQRDGTFLRVYVIEPKLTQRPPWTPKDWVEFLINEQRDRFRGLSFQEQQKVFLGSMVGRRPGQRGGQAGILNPRQKGDDGKFRWDPLHPFRATEYHEQVTVSLKEEPLLGVADALWQASGYAVVVPEDIEGQVTLEAKNESVDEVLEKVCQPLDLKWQRVYVVSEHESLTREQLADRMDQGWNMMWDTFFELDAPLRKQWLDWGIGMLKSIPPEHLSTIRASEYAPRMVERATGLMTRLNPDQRREITPLVQTLIYIFSGP